MQRIVLFSVALIIVLGVCVYGFSSIKENSEQAPDEAPDEMLDEALLRVPIPPSPVSLRKDFLTEDAGQQTVASGTYKRVLPGVTPATDSVKDVYLCRGKSDQKYNCYAGYLSNIVVSEGIPEAFIALKKLYNEGDSFAVSQCHQLVHVIGRAATTQFSTVAEAYNYGDTLCWSGYYHGIMEAIIAEMGIQNIPTQLNEICTTLPSKSTYGFNYFNCVHGLGHGVMYVSYHNLFKALALCDLLEDRWEQSSCYGGVYMENVIANEVDHMSEYFRDDDLLYPCTAVDNQYKEQCYLMQTSHVLKENGYDFKNAFEICATADEGHQNTCYQSLGRDASGLSTSGVNQTVESCQMGPDFTSKQNCIIGALKDFVSYYHSDTEAIALCDALPSEYTDFCKTSVQSYYSTF